MAKFRLKLKKAGKTTRSARYNLNQIPYEYTVEVTNRFNGLDLVSRVPEELWAEVCNIVQETTNKTIPSTKEMQEGKVVVWGDFTNGWGKKKSEKQGRKWKVYPTKCRIPENSKERQEGLLQKKKYKEIEENNRKGKTRDLFKKLGVSKDYFIQRWAH